MPTIKRRLFRRILLWQPATGNIIDLSGRYVMSNGGPSEEEEYARLASGSKTPTRRTSTVQIPVTEREIAEYFTVIQRSECDVKAFFLSINGDSWAWLEPTKLQITDPEVDAGGQAPKVAELDSTVFYPAAWESKDLIGGVPWHSTKEVTRNSNNVLRPNGNVRPGYEGPLWNCGGGDKVKADGTFVDGGSTTDPTLELQFPFWGSTIAVTSPGTSHQINAYNWSGTSIGNAFDSVLPLPSNTWTIKITLVLTGGTPSGKPRLEVTEMPNPYGITYGETSPDCTAVSSPNW